MTGPPPIVLVVDDEPPIRRLLRMSLSVQGWKVEEAATAADALSHIATATPDVVVLDLGLPDRDGLEVIAELRRAGNPVPIVVLSSRETEQAKVAALDLGADDYVTKPFGMEELTARLRTALRHRLAREGATPVFTSGDLEVDLIRRLVRVGDAEIKLSPREWDILALLVTHAGRVLTHRFLLERLWGPDTDVQQLRVYVRQLRQKIEVAPDRPRHIVTETGVGYRLVVEEPTS